MFCGCVQIEMPLLGGRQYDVKVTEQEQLEALRLLGGQLRVLNLADTNLFVDCVDRVLQVSAIMPLCHYAIMPLCA